VVPFFCPYLHTPQMVYPYQLVTNTAANIIRTLPLKLVTRYLFSSGPKTPLCLTPQVVDSTHSIFVNFDAQNHMFLDDNRKCVSPVKHCCQTSYNPVWPVIRTFPSTELTGT
jgi:hypothetical protein